MKKPSHQPAQWKSPSLEWIHKIRRERRKARRGRRAQPLARKEAEKLVRGYGLKLARRIASSR